MGAPKLPASPFPCLDGMPLASFRCQGCDAPLDWSQPDIQRPSKLLGVCGRCGDWHMLRLKAKAGAYLHIPNRRPPALAPVPTPTGVGVRLAVPGII